MNYTEIVNAALRYADREDDVQLIATIPAMVSIVEARANKVISTYDMATEYVVAMGTGILEFALPNGFEGLNTVKVRLRSTSKVTNILSKVPRDAYYALQINGILQDIFTVEDSKILVLTEMSNLYDLVLSYDLTIPSLKDNTTNWLSDKHCDCYIFGLVAEIYSYTKNKEGFDSWNARFLQSLSDIQSNSDRDIWNGSPLVIKEG